MDSGEEDFYYSSGSGWETDEASSYLEVEERGIDAAAGSVHTKNYIILTEKDVKHRIEEDIGTICNVLFVPKGVACALLHHYNWSVASVQDQWFGDEEKVRQALGLSVANEVLSKSIICSICFETIREAHRILSAACGAHPFCVDCWQSYISTSINGGPGCLNLCCPEPGCGSIVDRDMVEFLCCEEDKERYYKYLRRSYVENSRERKWCPAPGCEFAVQYDKSGCDIYDVICDCNYEFCWNCLEECHRPVDCDTVKKWVEKNHSEAENTNWILAYTKPCPKCKRPIEKNQGCNHMTCRKDCGFEFCWVCLEPYRSHGSCNKYSAEDQNHGKEMAKKHIVKYTHYYERWASNSKSRQIALTDLNKAKTEHVQKLATVQGASPSELKFVTDAWEQIVECRRVLKWTYAYGFYIPENELGKITFFEYLQGEAESQLEKLHSCAEKGMKPYLDAKDRSPDFDGFRRKFDGLTKASRKYFENLVRGLENGLSEVETFGNDDENTAASSATSGSKKVKKPRRR